jgi:glycopeptide antibiotics resistance protein
MFFGFGRTAQRGYRYNIIPLFTIYQFIAVRNTRVYGFIINIIGNMGVFIPFGILLPRCFNLKYGKVLLAFITGVTFFEVLQLVLKRGSFDVDDILLNTIGFNIGYGINRLIIIFLGFIQKHRGIGMGK